MFQEDKKWSSLALQPNISSPAQQHSLIGHTCCILYLNKNHVPIITPYTGLVASVAMPTPITITVNLHVALPTIHCQSANGTTEILVFIYERVALTITKSR